MHDTQLPIDGFDAPWKPGFRRLIYRNDSVADEADSVRHINQCYASETRTAMMELGALVLSGGLRSRVEVDFHAADAAISSAGKRRQIGRADLDNTGALMPLNRLITTSQCHDSSYASFDPFL